MVISGCIIWHRIPVSINLMKGCAEFMKKRIISMLLVLAFVVNLFSAMTVPVSAAGLSDSQIADNIEHIKEKVSGEGYDDEYTLFTSLLDKKNADEIKAVYSLSSADFTQILKWLRKYIENGKINGYSRTTAAEYFMNEQWEFIYDYFVKGVYSDKKSVQADFFVKDLPDFYWFPEEERLPDTLSFSVQVTPSVTADEIKWVVAASSDHQFSNYAEQIPYQISPEGFTSELTLSAEDILSLTSPVSTYSGVYKPDTIAVYAVCRGTVSNICYITVGGDVYLEKGAYYGDVKNGNINLQVSGSTENEIHYKWQYNSKQTEMDQDCLTLDGYWELTGYSSEEALNPDNTEDFEDLGYVRCNVSYNDWEGIRHLLSAPMMPVLAEGKGSSGLESRLYTPITCFVQSPDFTDTTYVSPGTEITCPFFTLADDAILSIEWNNMDESCPERFPGTTISVSEEMVQKRCQKGITAYAKAPSGKEYSSGGTFETVIVMAEDVPYLFSSEEPLENSTWDRQLLVKDGETFVDVLSLPNILLLHENNQYAINSYNSFYRLKVLWYVNTIPSREGAMSFGYSENTGYGAGNVHFNIDLKENSLNKDEQYYYYFCFENRSGEKLYTSPFYRLGLSCEAAAEAGESFYVSADGTLYSVLSNETEITVPSAVDGIDVKKINSNCFYFCPNVESVKLPETVESVESLAFESCNNSITSIHFNEGIKRIADNALPGSLEVVNLPSTLTSVGVFSGNTLKEVTVDIRHECEFTEGWNGTVFEAEKVIFSEGITEIGKGFIDFAFEAGEVVLPSTLKKLKPVKAWIVGEMTLPENIEEIDFGGQLVTEPDGSVYFSGDSMLGMKTVAVPESVKKLGTLGTLSAPETVSVPAGVELSEGFFAYSGIKSFTFAEGTNAVPAAFFYHASALETVVIPEGVTEIGDYAFAESGIKNIVLPSTLKKIGRHAFEGSSLETIELPMLKLKLLWASM